jgi:hypothetical protein
VAEARADAAEGHVDELHRRAAESQAALAAAQAATKAERERADALARAAAERASWSRWRRLREALRR